MTKIKLKLMYQGLLHLHNFGRWVVIILLLVAIVRSFSGMTGNKSFTKGDKKTGLFLMIAAHSMLLIGLYQWFAGPWGFQNIQKAGHEGCNAGQCLSFLGCRTYNRYAYRHYSYNHRQRISKKNINDTAKHRRSFWFYFTAFIVIIATVPWPFREVARPLFPGMH
ncbi:MAG: hypothetical protein WKG06_23850 [Segetibacter sp.]